MAETLLEPHQQRVVTEKLELDEKLYKLKKFIHSDMFFGVVREERDRLVKQSQIMDQYSEVLGDRIKCF